MKSNDFLSEDIASDAHEMQLDHEVQMARKDCYAAADDAIALHKLLRNISEQQGLEGWVAAKITLASDYLNTVREHLEYQLMSQGQPDAMALPVAEGSIDPAAQQSQSVTEMSAGSVAGVVNPPAKNKAKVGTLFGGTYKQKKTK
jgi:hypothetical protein